jgi:hypothetical protein
MNKLILLLFVHLIQVGYSADSVYHFGDPKRPNYFKQNDPYGINDPFNFEGKPENLDPYQNPWRPTVPIQRMPTNDQETIQPFNLSNPGVIRNL